MHLIYLQNGTILNSTYKYKTIQYQFLSTTYTLFTMRYLHYKDKVTLTL